MSLGKPRDGWAPINRNSEAQFWRTRAQYLFVTPDDRKPARLKHPKRPSRRDRWRAGDKSGWTRNAP